MFVTSYQKKRIMKITLYTCFILLGMNFFAQNTKSITVEKVVQGIKLADNVSVTVIDNNNQANIYVSGTFNDYTESNGILEFRGKSSVTISCSLGRLHVVHCRDKSQLIINSITNYDSLYIALDDYSGAHLSMLLNKLTIETKNYSNVIFSGHADFVNIQSSDFSHVNVSGSHRARYQVSDFANLKICALSEVNGKSKDFSKVTLSGNPLNVNVETHDFSKVSRSRNGCRSFINPVPGAAIAEPYVNDREEQEEDEEKSNPKKSSKKRYSWQGISAGVNAIMNENNSFTFNKKYAFFEPNYSSSFNFQLNPFQQNFYIYERNMAFITGIGIEWRIFGLRRKSYIDPDTSYFHGYIDTTSGFTLNKNSFRNFNLQIPFLFDFRFGKKNRFSFMTGVVGTWMLLSSQKMELTNNGYEYEIVKKDQFNLNHLQLKAHASMGYKDVHFFGEYAFNGMFLKNRGPAFRFLTVGLRYSFNYD